MQPDYPRNIVFKLIIDCIETQGETALLFLDIENRKNEKEPNRLGLLFFAVFRFQMMACFFSKFDSDILDFAILLTYLC